MGGLDGPDLNVAHITSHWLKFNQMVTPNLGVEKNTVSVYALKKRTWIPVKLGVSDTCLILKIQ